MSYAIKHPPTLRRLLLLDALLGGTTAVAGLLFSDFFATLLGLPGRFILSVSAITMLYALVAFTLLKQAAITVSLLRGLVAANWGWTLVSVVLLFVHYASAEMLGKTLLVLQIVVVGALAYLEGRQILKSDGYPSCEVVAHK